MVNSIIIDSFLGGVAPGRFFGDAKSQCDPETYGFDPTMVTETNILRRSFQAGTIANISLIQGNMVLAKTISRAALGTNLYVLGQDDSLAKNRLYKIDLTTNTIVNASPWPHDLPVYGDGYGLELYNSSNIGYLYYTAGRYLGRYDMSLTFNDSFYTFLGTKGLGDNIQHPMVQGGGKLFIGNSNFSSNAVSIATVTDELVNPVALDLSKTDKIVKALEYRGDALYIAATANTTSGSVSSAASSLYIWDGVSPSYQYEYPFPEEDFTAIKAFNGQVYCWGKRGFYRFNGSGFELIYALGAAPEGMGAVDVSPRGIMYFKGTDSYGNAVIYAYGSPDSRIPPFIFKPFEAGGAGTGFLKWVTNYNLYVGGYTGGDKMRRYGTGGASGYATGIWKTPMINMGRRTRLVRVYISFLPWTSGSGVTVKWAKGDGTTLTTIGTISTAGETSWQSQPDGLVGDQWQLVLVHDAGDTPKIQRIILDYEFDKE